MASVNLDDPRAYAALDPSDMYRRVNDLPGQIEAAWQGAQGVEIPQDYRHVTSVVITGMGGSAIGGSLLEAYGVHATPVPVVVWRNYGLPAFVGPDTLVIAMSYSGSTEETLSAFQTAHDRGAKLLAVSTGGKAAAHARDWNVPIVTFQYDAQPRATLGYLFTPLISIFARLGFLPDAERNVREAIDAARQGQQRWGAERPEADNLAKQLARACLGKLTVVYGPDYLGEVAHRWKTQFNENAKQWAFYEQFPELNHNAIVGYEYPERVAENTFVIVLDAPDLFNRVKVRMRVTGDIMERAGIEARTVDALGSGRLAHMISLVELGDYVTYYLALLNGADPTVIGPIDTLKAALAKA